MLLAAGGWCVTATCPNGKFRPGLALCPLSVNALHWPAGQRVKVPRVRDRAPEGERLKFTSTILPPYLRRAKSIEELLPWLYLKGISTGDFSEALAALLGPDAPGLSASTITRLKADWWDEYQRWSKRDLSARRYVYFAARSLVRHFTARSYFTP